jgi:hypothetical protein
MISNTTRTATPKAAKKPMAVAVADKKPKVAVKAPKKTPVPKKLNTARDM